MNNARDINKPEGQFREGVRYLNGDGVPKDMAKAAEYFEKAAKQGYKEAQCVLGHLYYWGKGVPRNTAKAKELFTKAAAQGFKEAKDALRELF